MVVTVELSRFLFTPAWFVMFGIVMVVYLLINILGERRAKYVITKVGYNLERVRRVLKFLSISYLAFFGLLYILDVIAMLSYDKTVILWVVRLRYAILPWLSFFVVWSIQVLMNIYNEKYLKKALSLFWTFFIIFLLWVGWVLYVPVLIKKVAWASNFVGYKLYWGSMAPFYVGVLLLSALLGNIWGLYLMRRSYKYSQKILYVILGGGLWGMALLFMVVAPFVWGDMVGYLVGITLTMATVMVLYSAYKGAFYYSFRYLIITQAVNVLLACFWLFAVGGLLWWRYLAGLNLGDLDFWAFAFMVLYAGGLVVDKLRKIWRGIFFKLLYPTYYKLEKFWVRSVDLLRDADGAALALEDLLRKLGDILKAQEVCIHDVASMPNGLYKKCVRIAVYKGEMREQEHSITTKFMLNNHRYMVVIQEHEYIPRELLDQFEYISSIINTLVNLEITFETLDNINKTLVEAVAKKTRRLNKKIERLREIKRYLLTLISQTVREVKFAGQMIAEYLGMLTPDNYREAVLRLVKDKISDYVLQLKTISREVLVQSQLLLAKRLDRGRVEIVGVLRELLVLYKPKLEARGVRVFPQLPASDIYIKGQREPVVYLINKLILLLINIAAGGELTVRCSPDGQYCRIRFFYKGAMIPDAVANLSHSCQICDTLLRKHRGKLEKNTSSDVIELKLYLRLAERP